MQIITTAVQKGGTGKTTTALALAQAAAYRGKSVLAIDLDPQGNFTFALGASNTDTLNAYQLITGQVQAAEVYTNDYGIDVIPTATDLATLTSGSGTARRLQQAIEPIKEMYDYIIIDTPPTAGELQYNALQAATGLIIPLAANIYNLQSLYQIGDTYLQIKQNNPDLRALGFILNMFDNRSNLAKQMQQKITETAAQYDIPFIGSIRKSVVIEEAAAMQQSIFSYAPNSKPAQDFLKLFDEIDH